MKMADLFLCSIIASLNFIKILADRVKFKLGISANTRSLQSFPDCLSWCEQIGLASLKNLESMSQSNPIFVKAKSNQHNGIYVLAYHSILNPRQCEVWETSYKKVATPLERFIGHIQVLKRNKFEFISLEESCNRLRLGEIDRPYAVFTFDDGYKNILNVLPIFEKEKICGTAFINGAFASQEKIYYRVLASILVNQGQLLKALPLLKEILPEINWSKSELQLYGQLKNQYFSKHAKKIEYIVLQTFIKINGANNIPRCHLNIEELKELDPGTISIASHSWSHQNLTSSSDDEIESELDQNINFFKENNILFAKQLAYPNGQLAHVGLALDRWLEKNKEWTGYFCNGGVNYKMFRKIGLRIPIGNLDAAAFNKLLKVQSECGKIFLNRLSNFSNHAND